ncbi:NlpC/P60 family protein [Luteipulveratus mongoliensis]|uniref:NlpC/P60 domain-containing protein n=1 Tax=Luteipulveratus mongoliensis TaxID=571913 RepID=A0A0K1JHR1_9MICO|nr:NlpC/P60 family protein [Luteipulveratus mongoliensis]AKU16133.1 hypothetical protein VV02_10105 [Luteipulveratus mongoliensis]
MTSASANEGCYVRGQASAVAKTAIATACDEVKKGTHYTWGGGHGSKPGPTHGQNNPSGGYDDTHDFGFDCSGLMRWAYYKATGVDYGSGGTSSQPGDMLAHGFKALPNPTDRGSYQPGDVIVWSGHTAMVIGDGLMVQAQGNAYGLTVKRISSHGGTPRGVYRYGGGGHTPPPEPVPSGSRRLEIYATDVSVRKDATSRSQKMGVVQPRAAIFSCQKRGERVNARGHTNDLWSYSPELHGYVNNVFMRGESDYHLKACGGGNPAPAPHSGGRRLTIYATDVNVRADATSASARKATVQPRTASFTCQKRGERVNARGYSNDLWSFSPELGGYVNNVFMKGPSNYGLPGC